MEVGNVLRKQNIDLSALPNFYRISLPIEGNSHVIPCSLFLVMLSFGKLFTASLLIIIFLNFFFCA